MTPYEILRESEREYLRSTGWVFVREGRDPERLFEQGEDEPFWLSPHTGYNYNEGYALHIQREIDAPKI